MSTEARIAVNVPPRGYDVLIGQGVLSRVEQVVGDVARGRRVALVTDTDVGPRYADGVAEALARAGLDVCVRAVPAGERSKSWNQAGEIVEWLAESGLDRTDTLVALGGGVVGDLAGFCAAVFLRGIALVGLPTTLLAQVDSSIGGKTAVDLIAGKNLAGAFIQPHAVISDTSTLTTLSDIEWRSGLGEVAKSAVLSGEEFLSWLESHALELLDREPDIVDEAVSRCVRFKAAVVSADEREAGERECLNLGHTLGHAIEKVAGYGVVPHGLAVAEGMRFAVRLAHRGRGVDTAFVRRVDDLLDALALRVSGDALSPDALRLAMSSDKKTRGTALRFVLPLAPGSYVVESVDDDLLAHELSVYER